MSYDFCPHNIRIIDDDIRCLACKDAKIKRLYEQIIEANRLLQNARLIVEDSPIGRGWKYQHDGYILIYNDSSKEKQETRDE